MKKAQVTRDTGINQYKEMIWLKRVKNKLQPSGQDSYEVLLRLYQIDEKSTSNEGYWDKPG